MEGLRLVFKRIGDTEAQLAVEDWVIDHFPERHFLDCHFLDRHFLDHPFRDWTVTSGREKKRKGRGGLG